MARPTRLTREQQRIVRDLIRKHGPEIEAAFLQAVRNARGALDFNALVRAIERNDLQRALDLLRLDQAALFPLQEAIRTAFIAGGASVTIPRGVQGAFSFNGRHVRAEQIIAETGARLVTEIGSPGVEPIRALILQAQQEGIGAQKTARRLAGTINRTTGIREGGIMGLDGPRAHRWRSVSEGMKTPEGVRGLVIEGRDGTLRLRYTTNLETRNRILAAYKRGEAVAPDVRARLERQFSNKLLKERSEDIAQNEAFRAQAQGRQEAYQQLLDSGQVESISKTWNHNTLRNPRDDHARLDGKTIDFDEMYTMDDGTQMRFPHDPSAGPEHSVNCRCSIIFRPQYRRPS